MLGIFVAIAALLFFNLFNFHFIFGEFEILFIQTKKGVSKNNSVFLFIFLKCHILFIFKSDILNFKPHGLFIE